MYKVNNVYLPQYSNLHERGEKEREREREMESIPCSQARGCVCMEMEEGTHLSFFLKLMKDEYNNDIVVL